MKTKKIVASLLSFIMIVSLATSVLAADITTDGGNAEVPVKLTTQALTFSVTVPTALPITVAANGGKTYATDAKIINGSAGAVKVTGVSVTSDAWKIKGYDDFDEASAKVNSKEIALKITGKASPADSDYDKTVENGGALTLTDANWGSIAAKNDGNTDEMLITYKAKVPARSETITDSEVALVTFSVAWDSVS